MRKIKLAWFHCEPDDINEWEDHPANWRVYTRPVFRGAGRQVESGTAAFFLADWTIVGLHAW